MIDYRDGGTSFHEMRIALREWPRWLCQAECRTEPVMINTCPRTASAAIGCCKAHCCPAARSSGIASKPSRPVCRGNDAAAPAASSGSGTGRSPCVRGRYGSLSGRSVRPQCSMMWRWLPGSCSAAVPQKTEKWPRHRLCLAAGTPSFAKRATAEE